MHSYIFKKITNSALDVIQAKGTVLWILHADKTPPHIGISVNGNYYSWKAKGLDFGIKTSVLQKSIDLLQLPSLQVLLSFSLSEERVKSIFEGVTDNNSGINCYSPIKKILDLHENLRYIYSMLDYLEEQGSFTEVYGQYLPENYKGLLNYTDKDIIARINTLRDV
jgi:hypothetical protein